MAGTQSTFDAKKNWRKRQLDIAGHLVGQRDERLADINNGAAWDEFADAIKQLGHDMLSSEFAVDETERAAGYRYLMALVLKQLQRVLYRCDPELPAFTRGGDDIIKVGLDNPDGINSWGARIRDDLTYRIYGRAGGERFVQFVQSSPAASPSSHFLHEFKVQDDGRYEIILSKEPHPGNWMPMMPGAEEIYTRRIQYDWDNEGYTEIYIERPGVSGVPACLQTPEPNQVAAELRALAQIMGSEFEYWQEYVRAFRREGDNVIPEHQPLASGHQTVRQTPKGFFVLEPDQAMLVTLEDPGGLFWSVAVGDTWFRSIDPSHRQSSLNGFQARPDDDGLYRFVLAHKDPGIANWLDIGGHCRGNLTVRYVAVERQSVPHLTVGSLSDILATLPPDTAHVTAEERAEIIARRARGYARRYADTFTSRWNRFE
jgi:hypothetical protein